MHRSSVLLVLLLAGCARGQAAAPPLTESAGIDRPVLVLGELELSEAPVVDGDTLKVKGLDVSLRLIGLDTEETFKNEGDRRYATMDWVSYWAVKRAASAKPVKVATPLGEEAKAFAERFFAGVRRVRLERDDPNEGRDAYNRVLAYVFAEKGGAWVNYNIECVRAGMSPYFMKYGNAKRFHAELEAAMREARSRRVGIWDPNTQHYTDYDERLAWWRARAAIVEEFEAEAKGNPSYIQLGTRDADTRLAAHLGREVTLLGTVGRIIDDGMPIRVYLTRRRGEDFPLIFHSPQVFAATRLADFGGELVRVHGKVVLYKYAKSGREQLEIVVDQPDQVVATPVWPPPTAPVVPSP